jgi:heme-degrading monooxygenase HmoA
MAYLVVRHRVRDYTSWKKVFDESEELRKTFGMHGGHILRNDDDPSEVIVALECESLERAREFTKSDTLRAAMDKAGVISKPEISYLNEVALVADYATTTHGRESERW